MELPHGTPKHNFAITAKVLYICLRKHSLNCLKLCEVPWISTTTTKKMKNGDRIFKDYEQKRGLLFTFKRTYDWIVLFQTAMADKLAKEKWGKYVYRL